MSIHRQHPDLDVLVPSGASTTLLFEGMAAGEGPVWDPGAQRLLFTDHQNSRLHQWTTDGGVTTLADDTDHGNGAARDGHGRTVLCSRSGLVAVADTGERTVVADTVDGVPLRVTIDLVLRSDGLAFFGGSTTGRFEDAGLGIQPGGGVELIEPRRDADGVVSSGFDVFATRIDGPGEVRVAWDDVVMPNGLAFSPDESTLYVVDTRRAQIRSVLVGPDGELDRSSSRVFFDFSRVDATGLTDGITVDRSGNVYCAAPGGVWVIDPSGRHLGTISLGEDEYHTNCTFGGADLRTLFITTHGLLASIELAVPGVAARL
jgi:gluconolactonase